MTWLLLLTLGNLFVSKKNYFEFLLVEISMKLEGKLIEKSEKEIWVWGKQLNELFLFQIVLLLALLNDYSNYESEEENWFHFPLHL